MLIYDGKWEVGIGWARQGVGMINDIPTIAELFERMMGETIETKNRINKIIE